MSDFEVKVMGLQTPGPFLQVSGWEVMGGSCWKYSRSLGFVEHGFEFLAPALVLLSQQNVLFYLRISQRGALVG